MLYTSKKSLGAKLKNRPAVKVKAQGIELAVQDVASVGGQAGRGERD